MLDTILNINHNKKTMTSTTSYVCELDTRCTNIKCRDLHTTVLCPYGSKYCTAIAYCKKRHVTRQMLLWCRFGEDCQYRETNCKFRHSDPDQMRHKIPCVYGNQCKFMNSSCKYVHCEINSRLYCMQGAGCKNEICTFMHPDGRTFSKESDAKIFDRLDLNHTKKVTERENQTRKRPVEDTNDVNERAYKRRRLSSARYFAQMNTEDVCSTDDFVASVRKNVESRIEEKKLPPLVGKTVEKTISVCALPEVTPKVTPKVTPEVTQEVTKEVENGLEPGEVAEPKQKSRKVQIVGSLIKQLALTAEDYVSLASYF